MDMHYRLNGLWIGILLVFLLSGVNGPAHSQLYLSMVNFQGGGFFPAASLGKALAKPEFLVDSNQNVTNSSPAVYKMGSTLMMSIGLTTGASAYSGTLIISATYTGQGSDSWTLTPSPASISISLPPNSSSTPITLSLAGMPSIVSKGKLSVQFQTSQPPLIRNGQNMSLPNLGFGYTTTIYQVLDTPNAPMSVPWIEVLNYSCIWAYGKSSAADVAQYYDLSGNSWKKPIYGWLLNGYWQTQQANNNIVGLVLRPNSVATPLLGNSQPSSIYGPYVPTVQ